MHFPADDPYWNGAAEFLKGRIRDGETVLALAAFHERFPQNPVLCLTTSGRDARFEWAVVHKGLMKNTDFGLLDRISKRYRPVFANEQFVIFTSRKDVPPDNSTDLTKEFFWRMRLIRVFQKTMDAGLLVNNDYLGRAAYFKSSARALLPGTKRARLSKEPPIFIHSLWRTGSTYIWNKFRASDGYYAYYEPFNEQLLTKTRDIFEAEFREDLTRKMSHPDLEKCYVNEYPILEWGGVPLFRKSFPYDDYCLDANAKNTGLRRYIELLIRYSSTKRTVMQFCRSSMRMRWLKENFSPSLNIYILRSPRHQWKSYMSFDNNYFMTATFLIAGKNGASDLMGPLVSAMNIPYYDSCDINDELVHYSELVSKYTLEEQYFVFYYIWLVSLLEAFATCDMIIDVDLISSDENARMAAEHLLRGRSCGIDLRDCRIKQYPEFALPGAELTTIEKRVQALVARELQLKFKGCPGRTGGLLEQASAGYHEFLRPIIAGA